MTEPAVIEIDHVFRHAPALVWRALTDPERHAKWWASGDVRAVVGHRFTLDMGRFGAQPCEVLAVENERLLRYRFSSPPDDTLITWTLFSEGTGTRLRLRHEGFNLDSPLGRQAFQGMGNGWPAVIRGMEPVLDELEAHVAR
jgi:uncharacterized protein YndB with AHSA1/START domain